MTIQVMESHDPEDREAIYRFLYDLWAGEFGRSMRGLDPSRRRMKDALDDWAHHFIAVDSGGRIVGCVRTNYISEGRLYDDLADSMQLGTILQTFKPRQVSYSSHLAVAHDMRGHTVASLLVAAAIRKVLQDDILLDLSYCSLTLVPMYYQIGSRPYAPHFRLEGAGVRVPMVFCPRDRGYLTEIRSPASRMVPPQIDDGGATATALARVFPGFQNPGFDRQSNAAIWARIAHGPQPEQPEQRLDFFDGFTPDDLQVISPRISPVRFVPGQKVYRKGEKEPGMGVVVSGSLGVSIGEEGNERFVALIRAGELFGELQAFTNGQRTADVVALEESEVLLLPGHLLDDVASRDPALAFRLSKRLARVLSHRLVASNRIISDLHSGGDRAPRVKRPGVYARARDISFAAREESYAFAAFDDGESEMNRLTLQATAATSLEFPVLEGAGMVDGMTLVDIGSGPGVFSSYLAQRYPNSRVVGVEPDATLRAQAQAVAVTRGTDGRCTFMDGTAEDIPLETGHADFCYARLLLQHLPKRQQALQEMVRVTRSGGVVCALDVDDSTILIHPAVPGWADLEKKVQAVQARSGGDRLVGRKLYELMRAAGLQGVRVSLVPVTMMDLGRETFYHIGFGFKKELLVRGGHWDHHARMVFDYLREHLLSPHSFAMFTAFVAHGVVERD